MSWTFSVLKFIKFKFDNLRQLVNIWDMFVTLFVFKLDKSVEFKFEQE